MSAHTPSPWRVIIDDTGGPYSGWPSIVAPEEIDASVVHRSGFKQEHWGDLSLRDCLANARLIAAAPDLLSIARRWAGIDGGAWHVDRHIREKAQLLADTTAAIARATGDTP